MSETFDEQLSRFDLMCEGDPTWDLSDKDIATLLAVRTEMRIMARSVLARESAIRAAHALVNAMETCHECKGIVLVEDGPVHCEDCSGDCDCHEEPECTTIYELHRKLKSEISTFENDHEIQFPRGVKA